MKVLKSFYKKGSEGYVELVEFNNHYHVGGRVADAIEDNSFNYAFWMFETLEEAEEKYKELEEIEMGWK